MKETPVTPEDFYYSQTGFNRWLRDLMPHEEYHLKSMLEEYGQMCAEQARREERERHSELISYLKEFMGSSLHFNRSTFKELLFAAGYEGKEEA